MNTKTDSIWAAAEHLLRRDAAVPLQIKAPPNIEGETQLIVRWLVETPAGRVGAWNRAALEYLLRAPEAPTAHAAPQPAVQQGDAARSKVIDLVTDAYDRVAQIDETADAIIDLFQPAAHAQEVAPGSWDDLPKKLMEAARHDALTQADRVAIGRAIVRIQEAAPAAQGDALTPEDADQLGKVINDFNECGETDVPYTALQRYAAMGYLECSHYHVLPAARAAIDAASAAKEWSAREQNAPSSADAKRSAATNS